MNIRNLSSSPLSFSDWKRKLMLYRERRPDWRWILKTEGWQLRIPLLWSWRRNKPYHNFSKKLRSFGADVNRLQKVINLSAIYCMATHLTILDRVFRLSVFLSRQVISNDVSKQAYTEETEVTFIETWPFFLGQVSCLQDTRRYQKV